MISMTPDYYKKVGTGIAPNPSPFLTPRPERRRPSSRGSEWGLNRQDQDREVSVQVILRCRQLSDDEQRNNVPKAVSCNEHKREVVVAQSIANKQVDRVFTFDKVFGPKAQQRSIYDQAIASIVDEVLDGFNCTVFAYGQTGTGKTYTMEGGGMRSKGGELPAEAGVIPRAVRQIFDTLEAQNADYSMRVTFLELYNEEVTDLLAPEDNPRFVEDKQKKSVTLLEDGRGCVIIRGLEEEAVYSANDIYNVLERGAAKRRTADTLLNKRSSRSHSVFTITIHVKESAVGDEELIKCGKLNLVDLAGSENISRSGAREGRAREAGEINKSLLTLGRVINALVEHSVHIPYRDSKLTRLLRDSLGGKTKTCIIANISSSAHCLEETLSTLDYAYRAKNIKNKPEANQKVSKTVLLKELYQEIEKMKQDVRAAREKNGVYVPHERYSQEETEKKARNERIEQLEIELSLSKKEVDKYREMCISEEEQKLDLQTELQDCKVNLENTNKALLELENKNRQAILELKEKEFIISKLQHSEASLIERAKKLRSDLENATEDITALHAKIDQKGELEAKNHELVLTFGSQLDESLKNLHKTILGTVSHQQDQLRCMEAHTDTFLSSKDEATKDLETKIRKMSETYNAGAATMRELVAELGRQGSSDLEQINSKISSQTMAVENFLETAVLEAKEVISSIKIFLSRQQELLAFSTQQEEGLQRTLVSTQMISEKTIGFFDELYSHSSKLMSILEESQSRHYHHLQNFEKTFKEQSAKEEKEAVDKIATILAGLTTKKSTLVSEALKNTHDVETEVNKTFQKKLSNIQEVLTDGKNSTSKHVEEAERHFLSNSLLFTQSRATMEEHLMGCSEVVDYSSQQWEKVGNSIRRINNTGISQIHTTVSKMIEEIQSVHNQYSSASLSSDKEFDTSVSCLLACANDSFKLDCKSKQEIDSLSKQGIDHLKSVQIQHKENVSSIRNRAERFVTKDYMVDQDEAPEKHVIAVPSEKPRSPAFRDTSETMESANISKNDKVQEQGELPCTTAVPSSTRAPFGDVNWH